MPRSLLIIPLGECLCPRLGGGLGGGQRLPLIVLRTPAHDRRPVPPRVRYRRPLRQRDDRDVEQTAHDVALQDGALRGLEERAGDDRQVDALGHAAPVSFRTFGAPDGTRTAGRSHRKGHARTETSWKTFRTCPASTFRASIFATWCTPCQRGGPERSGGKNAPAARAGCSWWPRPPTRGSRP